MRGSFAAPHEAMGQKRSFAATPRGERLPQAYSSMGVPWLTEPPYAFQHWPLALALSTVPSAWNVNCCVAEPPATQAAMLRPPPAAVTHEAPPAPRTVPSDALTARLSAATPTVQGCSDSVACAEAETAKAAARRNMLKAAEAPRGAGLNSSQQAVA